MSGGHDNSDAFQGFIMSVMFVSGFGSAGNIIWTGELGARAVGFWMLGAISALVLIWLEVMENNK